MSWAAMVTLLVLVTTGPSLALPPYLGEVRTVAFSFCPQGWAPMHGQLLSIAQNDALFSLIGTRYGGDGQTTFALPVGKPLYAATGEPFLQCMSLSGIYPSQN
jgi:microcystin-dependent protein